MFKTFFQSRNIWGGCRLCRVQLGLQLWIYCLFKTNRFLKLSCSRFEPETRVRRPPESEVSDCVWTAVQLYYRNSTGENPIIFRTYRIFLPELYLQKFYKSGKISRFWRSYGIISVIFAGDFVQKSIQFCKPSSEPVGFPGLVRELFALTRSLGRWET